MSLFVFPREIREINKWGGGQNTLRGVSKTHEKYKRPPVYFEPQSNGAITYLTYTDDQLHVCLLFQ